MKNPEYLVFNDEGTVAFVSAKEDVLFVDFRAVAEIDVDATFFIADV